jgi:hypothetical protein
VDFFAITIAIAIATGNSISIVGNNVVALNSLDPGYGRWGFSTDFLRGRKAVVSASSDIDTMTLLITVTAKQEI